MIINLGLFLEAGGSIAKSLANRCGATRRGMPLKLPRATEGSSTSMPTDQGTHRTFQKGAKELSKVRRSEVIRASPTTDPRTAHSQELDRVLADPSDQHPDPQNFMARLR